MAASPVNFLFGFLLLSITLWLVFIFASGLLAWILSRILGASVGFRVGGWKCLRDVVVKFKKGAIESVSVGEIKLSLRQSLVKLGVGFISRDPKLQVLICDLEVVMRPSNKSPGKKKTRKSRASGRGKWMIVGNIARYLSVCVTDLVLKTPKFTVEIKELNVDISKDGGSKSNLLVRLQILPIFVHIGEPRASCDFLSNLSGGGCSSSGQASITALERSSAPFICETFSVSCEFGHNREVGIVIKNMDISSGEVTVNLNEELLLKSKSPSKSSSGSDSKVGSHADSTSTKRPSKKQQTLAAFSKYSSMFPEKVSFNLPKLDVSFVHREHGLYIENNIMGIQLKSTKSRSTEDLGESTRLDFQLEFSEIHLLREAGSSILEILKLDLISFVYIPIQPISPVRAESEIKLGGTQCNIIMSRLKPWLVLHSSKKKKMVLRQEASVVARPQSTDGKTIMWTCNVSAPEMTIVLFNMAGSPVYHGCSQSSHLFANNISNMGTTVHTELGELNLHLADEYQECLKESVFGVESNCGSIMHVAKVNLDWGKKDVESSEEDGPRCRLGLSVDVTGMGVYLTFKRVESLVSTAISFQALLKSLSASKKKSTHSQGSLTKSSGKGTQFLKFNLQRCSIHVWGETGLENTIVPDPKRVNYGSQGGRVMINVLADGTPRNANIMSTISDEYQKLKYSVSLEIFQFSLCVNKEKQSTQMELERARSVYQEYMEENRPVTNVALFDMQNAKFVQRSGGLKDIAVCSLFSATDITVRWEPDVHLSLVELVLQLKLLVHNSKLQEHGNEHMVDVSHVQDASWKKEVTTESGHLEKQKKKESIFAVDVEMLSISAGLGDGVDAMVQVQSIFSENARIGVLLEGLMLSFNGARIFKSSRMQISRIPSVSASASDTKGHVVTTWDWVVQGLDFHICMPYRLQLRAIDDVIEDMLRGLKLIIASKTNSIFPVKKESSKVKKPSTVQFGCIKFCIRKLTADIEEEPIQGWLDEHHQLLKKEAAELAARLNFLDEFISKAKQGSKSTDTVSSSQERKISFNNVEVDVKDSSTTESMREEIYKRSFRSYYQACQNLVLSEGSGACVEDFQAGFRPSTTRTSLLSISALDLDVSLKKIDGGDFGMIEVLKKLDPVCLENDIPFSRLYGTNILLNTGSLVVQLRDYSFPLFSGSSGKCEGRLVLAQQGRFLLAAVSGRVLARSFHSILHVGYEMIEQALVTKDVHINEYQPEMTWKRMEFSVMLEDVQAHVAPTDVDPGAGLQWLPKILKSSPKVLRTGALLERVFMPCDMYFRYTRHKGGTPELKVKPLKELTFNSDNITATMTSRQFQVMLDVLTNLLFARLPKPRKSSLSFPVEDDEDVEEEADEVVPDGVEEVELAKINLEKREREQRLLLDDIRKLSLWCNPSVDPHQEKESELWMISGGRSLLVQGLKRELVIAQKSRKAASVSLRMALQKAAQLRLTEKEKNKSPSYAMRISLQINRVAWSMLVDGKSFAEAEISDMIYDFDRDYKDVGIARFTTKYFVVRNCLPNVKSDMLLSAWNPPSEWGKKVMLRVDARQGAPKDGNSPLELFEVEIYPLKIHLTEMMYRMMWEYFFPEEEQDSQRRQEVWKVSTTAGARRVKKGSSVLEASASNSHSTKESEASSKSGISAILFPTSSQPPSHVDLAQASKTQNVKANPGNGATLELRRTSSFDRTWEETVAESVANELVLQSFSSSKNGQFGSTEQQDEAAKNKSKDSKGVKGGRSSHEEKKVAKSHEEKRSRPRKMMEFHNIKISQVELLVTYEGQRFVVNDLKLLMDQFHRTEFTGTWRRLFSRVKKHIIWGVLKSVTGMQGRKFKDKGQSQPPGAGVPEIDLILSDNEGQAGKSDQYPPSWPKRPSDGAGDGFVTSIRGLFSTQRRKAKAFVLRTMRGEAENDFQGDWSESDMDFSPFARQLTITRAKKLIRRHTKKFRSRGQKGSTSQQRESLPSSPREPTPFDSDSSSGSSPYEDFHE
ncbi:Protein SABRE isoform B [Glycine soja]|uniref:Protein SABRE isoform B n=1 Tax=Glycine soja TaxID=3848 RepID=A0A445KYS3_GLYSO|nr:Protein SABRE isoform B [Glycine soja]